MAFQLFNFNPDLKTACLILPVLPARMWIRTIFVQIFHDLAMIYAISVLSVLFCDIFYFCDQPTPQKLSI